MRWSAALSVAGVALGLAAASGCGEQAAAPPVGARRVLLEASDGARLSAVELGDGTRGAVLLHGASTRKELWYPLLPRLADAGVHAIAFDARGEGDSTGEEGVDRADDVRVAIERLRDAGVTDVVLVGSSLGARTALEVASDDDLAGVVTFSAPGPDGYELDEPGLFLASEGDGDTAGSAEALAAAFDGEALVVEGDAHGADLLDDAPEATEEVVEFVRGAGATTTSG